ncbi:gamma-glutamylcyclotransferase family protein [Halomonas huangheensis]|uniref:Gamma-glutamylcyclotransferase AIG2-like domain-containing protein n=1 Tax=Halomonas huangheensis TaxID=1178482 RepID=W1NCN5_9GAMM|nr:gamma-glutamylcyclotransferase family protein [Halomonas huangheensis]ALM52540.1 hypothetical protein AR456_09820 [Halomonas huangheensis]ERL52956.1 hypothetical protein BJB45_16885 [Halomonas huangheensis]
MTTILRFSSRLALVILLLLSLMLGGAWLVWRSPLGYDRPENLPTVDAGPHEVFVYGTLRYPVVRWLVTTDFLASTPAMLEDYRRDGLDVRIDPGSQVKGELLVVDRDTLLELDRYERLGIRYQRIRVELANGQQAWLYQRLASD